MSILKTLFGSQFVSMYALFFKKIKKFIFNWINVDIFVTCIIFQSFIFEYLELELTNGISSIMFYETYYKIDEI